MAIFTEEELEVAQCKVRELDFTKELTANPIDGDWTQLGLWTVSKPAREGRVEKILSRQCLLVDRGAFAQLFPDLEAIGNTLSGLGEPAQWRTGGKTPTYRYDAFHAYQIGRDDLFGEPLVYLDPRLLQNCFCINPDVVLFLKLEETSVGSGVWNDPRHGNDVLRHIHSNAGGVERVEIRTRYLLHYLRARRQTLLFGHYQDARLYNPTAEEIEDFGEHGEREIGSVATGAKTRFEDRGTCHGLSSDDVYLLRRMHFWFKVDPPVIDVKDPWAVVPPFDVASFTFPTHKGPVAPALWKHFKGRDTAQFAGVSAEFMTPVYFRQEVLQKYQGASGFEVLDDGSVVCGHYWSLRRSTGRIGNELLTTAIGDFAEGVPFEEWNHWKQHAVNAPSIEDAERMRSEPTIPDAVNELVDALRNLNDAIRDIADSLGVANLEDVWRGSLDSLAEKQMKWVYPFGSDDGEFLVRATLTSTFVVDGILPRAIRKLLGVLGEGLERKDPTQDKSHPLGSRNLLQRLALVCRVVDATATDTESVGELIRQAETAEPLSGATDLEIELSDYFSEVRRRMSALAFLYELRTHGGVAHPPSPEKAAAAANELGLPSSGWGRGDYLKLLSLVAESVCMVAKTIRP